MEQNKLNEILKLHEEWLVGNPKGKRANLTDADLTRADLRRADLRAADLDFSCLPLWCGSLDMKVDRRISAQIAYHFCSLKCDDEEVKQIQESLYDFANEFHRVGEVKRLERKE